MPMRCRCASALEERRARFLVRFVFVVLNLAICNRGNGQRESSPRHTAREAGCIGRDSMRRLRELSVVRLNLMAPCATSFFDILTSVPKEVGNERKRRAPWLYWRAGKAMNYEETRRNLEHRIKTQFPALYITLVSVLIGLALADLVAEARARMVLWPITLSTLRTWSELSANGISALALWTTYAHIGISRRRVASLADSLIAFTLPFCLLFGNSFVGLNVMWPWFYFATSFLALSLVMTVWQVHILSSEDGLESFRYLLRPSGYASIFVAGVPFYGAAGWADQHNLLSPLLEVLCAATAAPAALLVCHLFLRDWHYAISMALRSDSD